MSNSTESAQKVALITGANKGIGLEITRQLGRAGMTVLLGARNSKQGEASAAILRGEGIDVHTRPLDLQGRNNFGSSEVDSFSIWTARCSGQQRRHRGRR